jgi:hypothetical protein
MPHQPAQHTWPEEGLPVGAQGAPLPPRHLDLKRQAVAPIGWHNEVPLPSENHLFNCLLVDWGGKLTNAPTVQPL